MRIANRKRKALMLVAGALATTGIGVVQSGRSDSEVVHALETATSTPDRLSPAGFLPAPNPGAYCDSIEYFNPFPSNLEAIAIQDNISIFEDTAWTNADGTGIAMKFTTVQQSDTGNGQGKAPTPGVLTPMVSYGRDVLNGGLSTIGIIMNGGDATSKPAIANVELSEPLFYSQWVFTDLDQKQEGFDLTPQWLTPDPQFQRYGMYGPDNGSTPGWSFETATPSTADHAGFYSLRSGNVDGLDLAGRFQVDFYGPITGLGMARYGLGGSGFATGAGCPPIGLAKNVTKSSWNAATQKFEVQYVLRVVNNLPAQSVLDERVAAAEAAADESLVVGDAPMAIDQSGLNISDQLDLTGFADVTVASLTSSDGLTVNPGYDGVTDANLLTGDDVLVAGGSGEVVLDVEYTPDFANDGWNDCSYEGVNQATVSAVAAGVPVSDLSDNGTDPKPASTNGDAGTDDPTPVQFSAIQCQVGLAKDYVEGSTVNNGDGTYTAQYAFNVGNYGEVNLTNFVLDDDLQAAYGDDYVASSTTLDECNALNASGGLAPGQFCNMVIDVVFKPISGILEPWLNQASITATVGPDPAGVVTRSDQSQDGTDPDPDGDGDPTNNTAPTPNQISAQIALTKRVSDGPTYNGDLTYDVTYTLVATNTGFAYLDNIVVDDDLTATFGDALRSYEIDDQCAAAVLANNGDSCEVTVNVTFAPDATVHWENSATVTGNAGGTEVTDVSQDGVDPDPDGNGNPGDNSDPTSIDVGFLDLALRIVNAPGASSVVDVGDTYTFNIEVFNQGVLYATDIEIIDYLPAELKLSDPKWTDNGDNTASYKITTPLAPGKSIVIPLTVKVTARNDALAIENSAEIVGQTAVGNDGSAVGAVAGGSTSVIEIDDIDSTPDRLLGNDELIDDEITLTPQTGDEDDEDITILALVAPAIVTTTTVVTTVPPTPTPTTPKTGGNVTPMLLLAVALTSAGFLLLRLRRTDAEVATAGTSTASRLRDRRER